jgi:hypothetical protein
MNKREYSSGRIVKQALQDKLIEHKHYIREHGEDLPRGSQLEPERLALVTDGYRNHHCNGWRSRIARWWVRLGGDYLGYATSP